MNKHEIQAFEHAVFTFNRLAKREINGFTPFKIIWDTKFGPATATNVLYNESRSKPIIKEEFFNDEYFRVEESNAYAHIDELYAYVNHAVANYFGTFGSVDYSYRLNMADRPHILMDKLLELSKFNKESSLEMPNYLTTWDFKTLDKSIQLPFVKDETLISRPLCLTKE
ncbi:hypothetical protein [Enterococcus faecalis]|jgi:hypothetical protein|uniref:hypothetical protein n=2 Tax=Enterococcus faecalis TaxID=1351 RepID=UPI00035404BB|nr:hypothetical protein [Enterococcus faecalis]AWQ39287.1 hypothetical protein CNQ40_05440 [Enterococcus faecalis]EGO2529323.1 hypothetical protein [Enterococcus faecalis]EGO7680261.1 hypothetical protein [Enterococcus faecalis]EGO8139359.1 hypothetical protein [Enterococcus faecalis]EGO8623970.1 hypothetical protein [Enterococcus faecalis]